MPSTGVSVQKIIEVIITIRYRIRNGDSRFFCVRGLPVLYTIFRIHQHQINRQHRNPQKRTTRVRDENISITVLVHL